MGYITARQQRRSADFLKEKTTFFPPKNWRLFPPKKQAIIPAKKIDIFPPKKQAIIPAKKLTFSRQKQKVIFPAKKLNSSDFASEITTFYRQKDQLAFKTKKMTCAITTKTIILPPSNRSVRFFMKKTKFPWWTVLKCDAKRAAFSVLSARKNKKYFLRSEIEFLFWYFCHFLGEHAVSVLLSYPTQQNVVKFSGQCFYHGTTRPGKPAVFKN